MTFARTFVALTAAIVVTAAMALAATPTTLTIPMKALNGSNENGTAVLTQATNAVTVTVTLKNQPANPQPTHIHIGTCGHINAAPEYPLDPTVGGKTTTSVPGISIAQLLAGHYAVNVHKSAANLKDYVSCGNIVAK